MPIAPPPPTAEPAHETAWAPSRPNQQLVAQQRAAAARQEQESRQRQRLVGLGRRLRRAFASTPLPLIAVQTHFSLLEGTASPAEWAIALQAWLGGGPAAAVDRRGGNHPADATAVARAAALLLAQAVAVPAAPPSPVAEQAPAALDAGPWAALADRDDLLGLPAVIEAWGADRVAIAATIAEDGATGDAAVTATPDTVLLAPTAAAYRALCRLLTARHRGGAPPPDPAAVAELVALVRDEAAGRRWAARGATVYWRAGVRPANGPTPFPPVAVPLVTHLADDRDRAPLLAALRRRGTIDPRTRPGVALADLLRLPDAYRGYEDQLRRSAELRVRSWHRPLRPAVAGELALHLPPLPPDLAGRDADAELRRLAEAGIPARYGAAPPAALRPRLELELAVIAGKRFSSYILSVWSIVRGHRTCGRGSAASSVVVYLLGITNVDPLRWNLQFDRFLSPERIDPPDIDVDFAWDERDGVLAEVLRCFGHQRVAMVATHQHLSRHGALREAARAHGLPDAAITAMADRIHDLAHYGVDREGAAPAAMPAPWPAVLALAAGLEGAPRHVGVHCGGVVITVGPLADIVPVHPAAKQVPDPGGSGGTVPMPTIAWEKDGAEDLGLVKIDLLGNRSLAVIRDCLADLRAEGIDVEATWTPLEDPATRLLLQHGDTIGCFYVESPAMRQLQAKVGDGGFDRLVVHSSIIRPAGMAFISTYIKRHHWVRRHGQPPDDMARMWYPHPALGRLLSESYGVLSYQEDVMVVARELAGFTTAEANTLRKALGRADTAERLEKIWPAFRCGCIARDVDAATIDLVWRMISSFAGYSFAKAHSASYAAVSMQCAWLKAHHPEVFLARVIANEGGFYRVTAYVEEARRRGLAILPPCVVAGTWPTTGRRGAIRLGFHRIAGLSRITAQRIEDERRARPFAGVRDLVQRTGCAADEARALIEAGAFAALLAGRDPAQQAWTVAAALHDRGPAAVRGQQLIALDDSAADPVPPRLPATDPQALRWRCFTRLGALPEAHPLCLWSLPGRPATRAVDLARCVQGDVVDLVALPITRKDVNALYDEDDGTQRTEDMAFVTVEDETGLIETTWFPETYRCYAVLLERHEPLLLIGTIEIDHEVRSLAVHCARRAVG